MASSEDRRALTTSTAIIPASIAFAFGFSANSFATHRTSIFYYSNLRGHPNNAATYSRHLPSQTTFPKVDTGLKDLPDFPYPYVNATLASGDAVYLFDK